MDIWGGHTHTYTLSPEALYLDCLQCNFPPTIGGVLLVDERYHVMFPRTVCTLKLDTDTHTHSGGALTGSNGINGTGLHTVSYRLVCAWST